MSSALHSITNGHGRYKTEIIIILRKGRRTEPIMEVNKENVSPIKGLVNADNDVDCLTGSFQKKLDINGIDKDGRYFLDVMKKETERLAKLCESTEKAMIEDSPSDEICGRIRAAIGKSKLLTTKKFKQFKGLCEFNLGIGSTNGRRPTNADLEGFWDMVMIQVDEVSSLFENINELRKNGWVETSPEAETSEGLTRKPSLTKKGSLTRQSSFGKVPLIRQRSKEEIKAVEVKQRAAARQRLAAAKRAARQKANRNSNPLDNVEIFYSPHK
ncbi:disks large-associated protein 1-like [Actinia tenebrosa]|uniref:Disks large-associated protein 1-like n=1 Tax=Actinia tenebrosa TaxID=6105 RepID=A0A6P8HV22_ACTTE|nr:disks large-associated protein 1-like [Actinia tenebrosa]XP_031559159.1 disks large-associated protein 1-like [Actinia tenebrosa]